MLFPAEIDWSNPVSDSPLNDNLLFWGVSSPGSPARGHGTKWLDISETKNDGTFVNLTSSSWTTPGAFNPHTLTFNGSSQYVSLPASLRPMMLTSAGFSVSAVGWSLDTANIDTLFGMYSLGVNEGPIIRHLGTSFSSYGMQFIIFAGTGGKYVARVVNSVTDNKAHHWCFTWNGILATTALAIYRDGVRVDTASFNSGGGLTVANCTATPWIGAYDASGAVHHWSGVLDTVRVFKGAMPESKVVAEYKAMRNQGEGLFRRRRGFISKVPAAGGFQAAWAGGSNVILGAGT